MIERNDILRAMEGRINGSYLGEAVYWDRLPKDFTPPPLLWSWPGSGLRM